MRVTRVHDTDAAPPSAPPRRPQGRVLLFALPPSPLDVLHLAVELAEAEGLAPVPVQAWLTIHNREHLPVPLDLLGAVQEGAVALVLQGAGWVAPEGA